jgi:bacterioferritin (cytochrome b1)
MAQCTLDDDKNLWKNYFDHSSNGDHHGRTIFNRLLVIYDNRLNTESNDTLKLTVSNMLKSLLNISQSAKDEARQSSPIDEQRSTSRLFVLDGFIESQMDHLKRVQTKLTLFSLRSDKCVSKVIDIDCIRLGFIFSCTSEGRDFTRRMCSSSFDFE